MVGHAHTDMDITGGTATGTVTATTNNDADGVIVEHRLPGCVLSFIDMYESPPEPVILPSLKEWLESFVRRIRPKKLRLPKAPVCKVYCFHRRMMPANRCYHIKRKRRAA